MVARFHYDESVYRQLLDDRLPEDKQDEVSAHVEECASCQSALETVSESDISWDDVRRYLQHDGEPTAEFDSDMMQRLSFLSRSEDEASVGRFGRYEIEDVLGCGGMGVVLRGFDPALNRQSAIKVLAPELAASAAARQRFSREAKSAAAVVHEHVVPIQTVDEENGLPYLVMPVIEGQSLEQRVGKQGVLETKEVLRIGAQIAAGLAAAHKQGLVHRDVKPANVLLENGVERVMITDFGLARAADDANMTRSGVIAGTPQYMSPEQARGTEVDHRSDLFSLGSVLYFMCTGRSPFRAETTMGVLHRISKDEPRPLVETNAEIPIWLEDIIQRLLAKDPADRFQTAAEVESALNHWLAHLQQPNTVPPPHQPQPARKQQIPSRLPKLAKSLVVAFLLVLAGVVITLEWNKGRLTINCPRDDVPIRITKAGKTYRQLTLHRGPMSLRVGAGQYEIVIEGQIDGLKIKDGTITLERRGHEIVQIVESKSTDTDAPDNVRKSRKKKSSVTRRRPVRSPWLPKPQAMPISVDGKPALFTINAVRMRVVTEKGDKLWEKETPQGVKSWQVTRHVITLQGDKESWIIDGRTGEIIARSGGKNPVFRPIRFTANKRPLVFDFHQGVLRIRDENTKAVVWSRKAPEGIQSVMVSSYQITIQTKNKTIVVDTKTGEVR